MYFRYLCIAAGFMIPVASLAQSDILTRQGNSGTVSGSLYGDGQSRTYNNPDIPDISPGSTGRGERGDRTTGGDGGDDGGRIVTGKSRDFRSNYDWDYSGNPRYLPEKKSKSPQNSPSSQEIEEAETGIGQMKPLLLRSDPALKGITEKRLSYEESVTMVHDFILKSQAEIGRYARNFRSGELQQVIQRAFESSSGRQLPPSQRHLSPQLRTSGIHDQNTESLYLLYQSAFIGEAGKILQSAAEEWQEAALMGMISADCYSPGQQKTGDFRPVTYEMTGSNESLKVLLQSVQAMNGDGSGFFSQLYYNGLSGKYVLAFRGSGGVIEDTRDWITNFFNAAGVSTVQYNNACILGRLAKSCDIDIVITGHSLGGGLAQAAALASGKPAYTFNAAGIPVEVVKDLQADLKYAERIRSYYLSDDVLSTLQDMPAERKAEMIGLLAGDLPGEAISALTSGEVAPQAFGIRYNLGLGGGHKMIFVNTILGQRYTESRNQLENFRMEAKRLDY